MEFAVAAVRLLTRKALRALRRPHTWLVSWVDG